MTFTIELGISLGYTVYRDHKTSPKAEYKKHVECAYNMSVKLKSKQGKEYADGKQLLDAYIDLHLTEEHQARVKGYAKDGGSYFPLLVSELNTIYKEL